MNSVCVIALSLTDSVTEMTADYIGADRGALFLAQKHIHMIAAIGDFDSVSEAEYKEIRESADQLIRLNPIKNDSDSEAAVRFAADKGYETIILTGALGGRIDHEIVNMKLVYEFPNQLILQNDQNQIQARSSGSYEIEQNEFLYFSVFAAADTEISLSGFKYPLHHRVMKATDLYGLSNELTGSKGILTVHSGIVITVRSRDSGRI